jgi:hypothetical protein
VRTTVRQADLHFIGLLHIYIYRVYKKKLNRFEIALNFAKQLFVSGFYIYIASLGTYNVE